MVTTRDVDALVPSAVNDENATSRAGTHLVVSEIFGPTFQGEGRSLGTPCVFLRLGGCNQTCVWCDTPYTWDWTGKNGVTYNPTKELTPLSYRDTVASVMLRTEGAPVRLLVISGGEPLLQQRRLCSFLEGLHNTDRAWDVEIETAGTIAPLPALVAQVSQFNVSPKLANSGNQLAKRYRPQVLRALQATGKATWKFVVTSNADFQEIDAIVGDNGLGPVYIMPEGKVADTVNSHAQAVAEEVVRRGYRLTTRLHVHLYGNRRGV